jgi:RimJ/RimL family protein N-acetyltransferase
MTAAEQPIGAIVDTRSAALPQPGPFAGRHARVEKLDPAAHGADLWRAVRDDGALWTYMGYGPFDGEGAFLSWLGERAALPDPYSYAVIDLASGKAVGIVTLMEIRPAMRVIEIGNIVYSGALKRTRAATEVQYLMARYAFEQLGYRRYEWKCNALNAPSMRAARRYGFKYEGIFRHHMIVKGRNRDTAWFAMTNDDWPAARSAFERWLDPANFDHAGGQKESLAALNGVGAAR